jgi:hypothetical protein
MEKTVITLSFSKEENRWEAGRKLRNSTWKITFASC